MSRWGRLVRDRALSLQFLNPQFPVVWARQRREKRNQVVDVAFRQRQGLDVLIKPGILEPIALVVVVHHVPKGLLRAIVEVRPCDQHVSQVGRLEGGDVGFLLGDQEAPERGHIRLNGSPIDGGRIARIEELLRLAGQGDDVMPNDADADVVKVVVREVGNIPLGFRQSMALIAAGPCVEKLPAALGGVIDSVCVASDEVIER